jgi:hypothetical protein
MIPIGIQLCAGTDPGRSGQRSPVDAQLAMGRVKDIRSIDSE